MSDVVEIKDAGGASLFFDVKGKQLVRCFGGYRLSTLEMRILRLEPTDLVFPGGYFLRKLE